YSTYLGGADIDFAHGVAVDAAGQAHVVGSTLSKDFPTRNALHAAARDPYGNGFLAKLDAAGTALVYSTYLSGTPKHSCGPRGLYDIIVACGGESASAVATDAAGNAYVTGNTISEDFPAPVDALQPSLNGYMDAFVIKLDPAGRALYSTYLGGSSADDGADIHADAAGTVYLFGHASSDDFPTVNPYRDGFARDADPLLSSFVARLSGADAPGGASLVRFDSAAYSVGEGGGSVRVGVTRAGDLSRAVEVDYSTGGDGADERADYTTARGTLRFEPGESSGSFTVSVTDDNSVEGDETLGLTLHNLRGEAVLAAPSNALLTIADDDEHPSTVNPVDSSPFFVRQHYLDFLGREPDAAGLAFWTNEIERCGSDAACREVRRVNVSAAFFLSIEFQETGFLVTRLHRLAFRAQPPYRGFVRDAREVGDGVVVGRDDWRRLLYVNRRAYAAEFAARAGFRAEFPESLTAPQYVERLNANASGALSTSEFAALVAGLEAGTETRATALLKVADDADFRAREFSPAFVLMQYLGYLRRNPSDWPDNGDGYNFWLAKLERFGGDWRAAEMVKAFINSDEYRRRSHEPATEAALGSPFKLRLGELAVVQPDKLRVSLLDVGYDWRCPRGSQCPNPGSISIILQAVKPGGETARFILSIQGGAPRPHPSNPPAEALGYKFRLLQLDPEPPQGTHPAPSEALLQVDKN
ncbi:MAG TPA: SBBP repeat-containing protein, partial [Pyrinomonadaceae bacterium]